MTLNQKYWIALIASLIVAFLGWDFPGRYRPLDYDAMIWRSIPLACLWGLFLFRCLWLYKRRGLWLLVGAPMALYWPIWLLFNRFPACYYSHNCE